MAPKDLVQRTFKYHIIIMKIVGLYPFESWPKIYRLYSITSYILFTFLIPMLAITKLIISGIPNIETLSQDGFMIVQLTNVATKIIPCITNPEGTKRTIHALNQNIFKSYMPEQERIISEVVENCRYIYQLFSSSCLVAIAIWAYVPLLYEERIFPVRVWLPFDPFGNTAVYLAVYIFQVLCVVNSGGDNTTVDTLIACQIYHAASQIRILKDTLMYLGERTNEEISKNRLLSPEEKEELKSRIIYKKICHCIDHYEAIYKFVKDLESTYSLVAFSQMFSSIVVICICCLHLSVVEPFTMPFFGTITFGMAIFIEVFLYCYSGTLLYEESNSVVDAIYLSEWYTYDEQSKKALLILMERAKKPMKVTAGKFLELSLQTFATILRRSYSLLAVLKNY